MQRIRDHYDVPAKRGGRVRFQGREGVIVGTQPGHARLLIRLDGDKRSSIVHPTWEMEYLAPEEGK